jgi:hypothetical protein
VGVWGHVCYLDRWQVSARASARALVLFVSPHTRGSGWSHVTPKPQLSWTPQLQTSQTSFSSDFSLSVVPTVTMKLNDVFTYSMTATPNADLKVAGDLATKSVCANSTVSLDLHSHSELHFDVDWLHIHDDKTWDKDIYSSGDVSLQEICIHL